MTDPARGRHVWEVLHNGVVMCSREMRLTKWQAQNNVDNENRMRVVSGGWSIRRVPAPKGTR